MSNSIESALTAIAASINNHATATQAIADAMNRQTEIANTLPDTGSPVAVAPTVEPPLTDAELHTACQLVHYTPTCYATIMAALSLRNPLASFREVIAKMALSTPQLRNEAKATPTPVPPTDVKSGQSAHTTTPKKDKAPTPVAVEPPVAVEVVTLKDLQSFCASTIAAEPSSAGKDRIREVFKGVIARYSSTGKLSNVPEDKLAEVKAQLVEGLQPADQNEF